MTSNEIGLVIVEVGSAHSSDEIGEMLRLAVGATPPGRVLVVVYPMPKVWGTGVNIEHLVTQQILPRPDARTDADDWEFFGNLGVRVCEANPSTRRLIDEWSILLFRRQGPKAYSRRKSLSEAQLSKSRLDVLHPVFTRDVANNVWHLNTSNALEAVRERLAALLAWPDEYVSIIRSGESLVQSNDGMNLDSDLVGVPTKVEYQWATKQLALDFTAEE